MRPKKQLDLAAATVCLSNALPLGLFELDDMKHFLHLLNPAYKPPSRRAISRPLLLEAYSQTKNHVDQVLSSLSNLNIITDESTNIRGTRIVNISIHTDFVSFH